MYMNNNNNCTNALNRVRSGGYRKPNNKYYRKKYYTS